VIDSLFLDALQVHNVATAFSDTLALTKVGGLGAPVPRGDTSSRPRRDGELDRTTFYAGRIVTLEGYAQGATQAAAWAAIDALKGAVALGSDHVLKFTRQGLAYAERATVRASSELAYELAGKRKRIKWAVALRAADPRLYADIATSANYSPSTSGSGITFPLTFPLTFLGAAGATMTVTNGGNYKTPPVFTITGPATTPGIRNETTGEELVTTATLLAGETLTIDVAARTVLAAGGVLRPDLIDPAASSWFELGAGATVLRLTGSGFAAGQSSLAVAFRDARI
jgi:hypothetical protein